MRKTTANPTYKETVFYSALRWLLKLPNRTADKKNRTRLMVFGDSNSYRPGNTTDSWPSILQKNSKNCLLVINESCDGRTTYYDEGKYNGLGVIKKKLRNALPLSFVLVALGTNDVKARYGPPNAVEVVEGIEKIIKTVITVDPGITPILLTPPPLGNVTSGDLSGAKDRIPTLVAEYHRYASMENISIIDLYSILDPNDDLEQDCVHLNNTGRKKIADIVWDKIQIFCRYNKLGEKVKTAPH